MISELETVSLQLEKDVRDLLAEIENYNATQTKASGRRVRTKSVALGKLAKQFRALSV